jgi:hypothetical protein
MASIDLANVERRARTRYESARAKRAAFGSTPVLLVTLIAAWLGDRPQTVILVGSFVFTWAVLLLWYGREPRRAVLPGIAAGLVPLAFALCANLIEHGCTGAECFRLCVPACALGGVVAGLAVAAVGHRRRRGAGFWVSASGIALLTGAMGCACVGYAGVVGMMMGYGAGLVPGALRTLFGRRGAAA